MPERAHRRGDDRYVGRAVAELLPLIEEQQQCDDRPARKEDFQQ